jgi:hypothetical protein
MVELFGVIALQGVVNRENLQAFVGVLVSFEPILEWPGLHRRLNDVEVICCNFFADGPEENLCVLKCGQTPTNNLLPTVSQTIDRVRLLYGIVLPPEAAQLRKEVLALIQKLEERKELTDLQLDTIITDREQLHLSEGMIAMRLQCPKFNVTSVSKRWAMFH